MDADPNYINNFFQYIGSNYGHNTKLLPKKWTNLNLKLHKKIPERNFLLKCREYQLNLKLLKLKLESTFF